MTDDKKFITWFNLETGETLDAVVYERYTGLRGQERVGLVDSQGRVHHFDSNQILIWAIPGVSMCGGVVRDG